MQRRPVILMLIPNLNFGGAQRVFYNLSQELSKEYEVVECVFNFDLGHAFKTGNRVVSLDVPAGDSTLSKIRNFFLRCTRLRKIKKQLQPAVSISHLEGADLVNVLSGMGEKKLIWIHGSKKHDENIEGVLGFIRHTFLIPLTLRGANRIVTVSEGIKNELVAHYRVKQSKVTTLYNFFDGEEVLSKSSVPIPDVYEKVFGSGPTIAFSGRLVRQKNPLAMLAWFANLKTRTRAKLIIIGDGELREEMLRLASELRLTVFDSSLEQVPDEFRDVYFLGFQSNPFSLIKRSSIFILPSLWEGFPMVLGEAMICKVPIVSADCPTGPKEFLSDAAVGKNYPVFAEFGILMPLLRESSFDLWSETVSNLLNDRQMMKHYSEKAGMRGTKFSKENNAYKVTELIRGIVK